MTFTIRSLVASKGIGLTIAMFFVLFVAFGIYVYSEKQIDNANELRQSSWQLADALRQSSDDLTRMARTYVVTGDPIYKQHYQDVLDIRDGKKPRPEGYFYSYWDLVLTNNPSSRPENGQAIALLELLRQSKITDEEFSKLAEAKANSDGLTVLEREAMELRQSDGPDAEADWAKARLMLHDDNYHRAKAAIMRPINEFFRLMDRRTLAGVHRAEAVAMLFRMVFILVTLGMILMLWRSYAALRATLGATADEVHAQILRIGRGDFSAAIQVPRGMENSVLAGLFDMQTKLKTIESERKLADIALRQSEKKFSTAFSSSPIAASIATVDGGRFIEVNANFERDFGWTKTDLIGRTSVEVGIWPDAAARLPWAEAIRREGRLVGYESIWMHKNGERRNVSISGEITEIDGNACILAYATDITARKRAEADLRIAAAAFESQDGMMITDADGVILRVNRAFTEITGYAAEEAVGQTPDLLKSGRHSADFYRAMWETIHLTGGWQGEVWDRRKNGEVYPKWLRISAVKDDHGAVTHYIGAHSDITERKKAEEKINELAFFDQLTSLPNRTLLLDRLRQAMTASSRNGGHGALLFIDLDNFRMLNDTLGHDMGDLLLKQVAQRLTKEVRAVDTVARLGGDEFVVMLVSLSLSEMDAATKTEAIGEKLLAVLNQTYQFDDVTYHCSASIGASLFKGHQTEIDVLLKQAELAMYRSKEAGRNALRFFDPGMETIVMQRAALEKDLREAVQEQQFLLHYQAQVVGDGRVTGAEVLVRWQHPRRGMVSPAEFIPLAEETGLVLPLGQWVLETACSQLAQWATRPAMAHLTIAVNVSAFQFRQRDFVDRVLAVLHNTGANPQRLKLELTESLLVSNIEEVIEKMYALKAKGVGFSLDDFGTGYSSLSYLKRLPLDQLKIDQSFVRDVLTDPNDASIARTIIALAQSLGLGVIAEGVETAAQQGFLASSGCHAYQGYFFSRPLPLEEFAQFAQKVWHEFDGG